LQSWSRTGSEPFALTPLSPAAADQVFADLRSAPQITEGPSELMAALTTRELATALAVAEFLAPEMTGAGSRDGSGEATGPSTQGATGSSITDAPVIPFVASAPQGGSGGAPTGGGGPTGQAQIAYNGQTVTAPGSLYSLAGNQTDTLAVPILEAVNSSLTIGQSLMDMTGGSTFTSTGGAPLLYLDPSNLSAASGLTLSGAAHARVAGSLLQDHGGGLDFRSHLLQVSGSGRLTGSSASALVDLVGSKAATAGGLLSASGGAVVELLKASAPLLRMTQGAALAADRTLVELAGGAAVKLGQLTALTASSLTIKGHGVSLSGGASLEVAGDLFRIANGSTLTITNGALLSLSGTSALNVTGALINFIGTGNTLSISNTLCGGSAACTMIGDLPVFMAGGGTVNLTNPVLNLTGNTLNIAPGSAVISVTAGSQVKQGS
ncbi:MAG: hypothetical protein ACREK9_12640, partial [Candidatus Rokuibacteriota bacterium]